jgi:hypothetical protein
MNRFEEFFRGNLNTLTVTKWYHYFDIYDRHFAKYKNTNPNILEIGTGGGGGAEMFNYYFDGKCNIVTFDGTNWCQGIENYSNIKFLKGDQTDVKFLKDLKANHNKFDIILDDASHEGYKTIASFNELYDYLTDNGTYLIEDLHTSYWAAYSNVSGSFVDFTKKLVDRLNVWHWQEAFTVSDLAFCKTTDSIHYYDSIVVLEKRPITDKPICECKGPAGSDARIWDDNADWLSHLKIT